ncbi:hypothetical protein LTS12_023541 [Elasticomyces elasticus]|nr:hypothetical protein LTS12_023541 [Elasticomyces elasticus]
MPREDWPTTIPIDAATGSYLSPDTTTTTRTDFTDFFLRFRPASDANPHYTHLFNVHQRLVGLLINHPAMIPNLQQTFSTPANSKNKVYFMWDFLLRTLQHLAAKVDPKFPDSSPMFRDVFSRAVTAKMYILDTTGKLERANASVGYSDDDGVEFTDEVKALAETLDEIPDGCAGCGKEEEEGGEKLHVCAKCKKEKYCSRACQRRMWKVHKRRCTAVTA